MDGARPDRTHNHVVVVPDDKDLAAAAGVALHRLLGNGDRIAVDALLQQHADVHARQQLAVRIRKFATQRHLAGRGIDLGFGKQEFSRQRIERSIVQHEADFRRARCDALQFAALECAAQIIELASPTG